MIDKTNWLTTISNYAEKALLYEVALTPKPGLVDRQTNGAHRDMNFFTFIDSIVSLTPFFPRYLKAGLEYHQDFNTQLFGQLRNIGKEAELAMLEATNGVNTHKGANFSFAILLGATGVHLANGATLPFSAKDSATVLKMAGDMTHDLVTKDFQHLATKPTLSYGEKLYLEKGITGIRGEAADGYPSLLRLLDYLRSLSESDIELRYLRGLIFLMSTVEDGNILHRGGWDNWQAVKETSADIHQKFLPKKQLIERLTAFDVELIEKNLSPGGAADLLALGIYFAQLEAL